MVMSLRSKRHMASPHMILNFLYNMDSKFVNSNSFSILTRKEGYMHNLPRERRHIVHSKITNNYWISTFSRQWCLRGIHGVSAFETNYLSYFLLVLEMSDIRPQLNLGANYQIGETNCLVLIQCLFFERSNNTARFIRFLMYGWGCVIEVFHSKFYPFA